MSATSALQELVREVLTAESELARARTDAKVAERAYEAARNRSGRAGDHRFDMEERLKATQRALNAIVERDQVRPEAIERIRAELA